MHCIGRPYYLNIHAHPDSETTNKCIQPCHVTNSLLISEGCPKKRPLLPFFIEGAPQFTEPLKQLCGTKGCFLDTLYIRILLKFKILQVLYFQSWLINVSTESPISLSEFVKTGQHFLFHFLNVSGGVLPIMLGCILVTGTNTPFYNTK